MSKLPPLPEPDTAWVDGVDQYGYDTYDHAYSEEQLKEYGQQCRDAALEEAAKFIESGNFLHDQSPAKLFADQLAPKIRNLK